MRPREAPPSRLTHAEVRTVFLGLMLGTFLAALNQTVIATALPTMGRAFGDFESLSWLVTSYLLTSTAVSTLYGKLSDIHGRRKMMLTAIGLFVAGSVVCALAPNMPVLILGRGLQGLGGGGILPLAQAVIADIITPRERGRYQAYMGVVWVTVRRRRAGARRLYRRTSALDADLLDQPAARDRRRLSSVTGTSRSSRATSASTSSTSSARC